MPPGYKSFNNGENLFIISFLPNFSRNHFSKEVSYWDLLTRIQGQLTQNTTYDVTGGIRFNPDVAL